MTGPSFVGRTAAEIWFLPNDSPNGEWEARFSWCYTTGQRDGLPLDQNWYGATLDALYAGIRNTLSRGCDTRGTWDKTQESGPSEKPKVLSLYTDIPDAHERFAIGTAPGGYISHIKGAVFNSPRDGRVIPPADFDTVDEAAAAGYPFCLLGSWNPSPNASRQNNVVMLLPGIVLATSLSAYFEEIRLFMLTQTKYQP